MVHPGSTLDPPAPTSAPGLGLLGFSCIAVGRRLGLADPVAMLGGPAISAVVAVALKEKEKCSESEVD